MRVASVITANPGFVAAFEYPEGEVLLLPVQAWVFYAEYCGKNPEELLHSGDPLVYEEGIGISDCSATNFLGTWREGEAPEKARAEMARRAKAPVASP